MFISGYGGMPPRYYDHTDTAYLRPLQHLNVITSVAAFFLGAAQLVFALNFIQSRWWGKRAGVNPWEVGTLEWTLPSPPKHHNFDTIPVVLSGPHEFSHPALQDRDWLPQTEAMPALAPQPHGKPAGAHA
jgi:cytochrome c oxidase subunit 1